MFHSEILARVIHADRVRDLERAAEAHRLVTNDRIVEAAPSLAVPAVARRTVTGASAGDEAAPRIGGSTGLAA